MRVGINFNPAGGTGIPRYSRNLLVALGTNQIGIHGLGVTGFALGKRDPRPEWLPDTVHYQNAKFPGRVQQELHRRGCVPVERLFNLCELDLIHTTDVMLFYTKLPRVTTVHDVVWRHIGDEYTAVVSKQWMREAEECIVQARHICADSHATAQDLMDGGISAQKITVTPLGVGSHFKPVGEKEAAAVREQYSLPEKFILYVGSVNARKNIGVLVKALNGMSLAPRLILAGPHPPEGLEYWGLTPDIATHLGFVTDKELLALYSIAQALVFPSLLEGFGLPLLEALAMGVPVVASHIPVFEEIAKENALYFDPTDPKDLQAMLERLLRDGCLGSQLRDAGRTRAALFSWDACAEATRHAYEQALR